MKIAVTYQDGQVCDLAACREFLVIEVQKAEPVGKELLPCNGTGATSMLSFVGLHQIDVLICGALGIASRNALEMLGVMLIPGVTGSCEEAAAKFLVGEAQGDATVLTLCREEDPDDPMNCIHDCSKCAGCGPIQVPEEAKKNLPKV